MRRTITFVNFLPPYNRTTITTLQSVIVLCSIPVVQFCTYAFDGYARYTTISTLLGVQVS